VNAASLVGFALVFVCCVWTLSAIGGAILAVFGSKIERRGPLVARRIASTVALVPVVLAIAVVATLVLQSALGTDHCPVHDQHAHLCLVHGTEWVQLPWVVVTLAIVGATMIGRAVVLTASVIRGGLGIRALHAISRASGPVRIVESERAFCFVAGRRPAVYVSSRVWNALSEPERTALLAHEAAHVTNGDLRKRIVIEVGLAFAAPLVGERARATWLTATERLCDARAAQTSSPEVVASAMVSLFRLETTRPAASFGLTPTQAELASRVEAVLAARPLGERMARGLGQLVVATCGVLIVSAAIVAEPLHHAFETLLG
jgi:hypothetical protein